MGPSSQLSLWTKLAFGTGHIHNDLCVSMWFSYALVFFTKVLKLTDTQALFFLIQNYLVIVTSKKHFLQGGALTAFGQYADGVGTLLIGYLMGKKTGLF